MSTARWDRYPDRASARRAAARELHPDRGGSAREFAAALAAIDVHFGPRPKTNVVFAPVRRRRWTRPIRPLLLLRRRRRFIEL